MSHNSKDKSSTTGSASSAPRGVLLPVTRLVATLSLGIINGRLIARPVPMPAR